MKIAKVLRIFAFAAAFILIASSSAFANTFSFANRSGSTISEVYFRPSGNSGWGNNILGGYFYDGETTSVSTYTNARYWDVYVVVSNGRTGSWVDLDLYTNQKVTITRNGCQTSRA